MSSDGVLDGVPQEVDVEVSGQLQSRLRDVRADTATSDYPEDERLLQVARG